MFFKQLESVCIAANKVEGVYTILQNWRGVIAISPKKKKSNMKPNYIILVCQFKWNYAAKFNQFEWNYATKCNALT